MEPRGETSSRRYTDTVGGSTIRDIWQYSEKEQSFNPDQMNDEIERRRWLRKHKGPSVTSDESLMEGAEGDTGRAQINVNLQRSLQLLDEAVGVTPGSVLRSAKKAPMKHVTYTPRPASPSHYDSSLTLGRMITPRRSVIPSSSLSMSPMLPDISLPMKTPELSLHEEVTTTNVGLLLEEDPGIGASTALYSDFLHNIREHPSEHQIFDLLDTYSTLCKDQAMLLRRLVTRATPGQHKFIRTLDVLNMMEQEHYTWKIMLSLFRDRLEVEAKGEDEEPMMIDGLGKRRTEKELVMALYAREDVVRQSQLVIDWLEKIAAENLETFSRKVEFFQDQSAAWENTLHHLQHRTSSGRPLVTQLDPDAPIRQKRPLADLDQEDDVRLLKHLFVHIRAGQLEEAQRLCTQCGQAWRAATLEGWKLSHDSVGPGGEVQPVEGNSYRDIWRAVCWEMAKDEKLHTYERALYASFSGNLQQILQVCETWEDHIWAYFKVLVDTRVEQELRVSNQSSRTLEELPLQYWDRVSLTPESVFKEVEANPNDNVRREAGERYHIVQKHIVLGDVNGLVEQMYRWVKDADNVPQPHLIRFMAHVVLFLRTIGRSCKEDLCAAILETYVAVLIQDKHTELVAAYTATLPQDLQVEWYARFLEEIDDKSEREQCLKLAEDSGLDIPSITKLVVENIRSKGAVDFSVDSEVMLESTTTPEDRQKIEAIGWLVYDQGQRAEAIRQANAVMRSFIGMKKHNAAREVFSRIPNDSIDIVVRLWKAKTGTTDLCAEDENAVREFLCIQAYLDAQDSFSDWFEHYHNAKPPRPVLPTGAKFTEKVAFEHQEKQYEAGLQRWNHTLKLQTTTCKERLYNVLLFVDGGWMVDQRQDSEEDETRGHQMVLLRQLCLPAICSLLHTVLHSTGQYKEALQLADIIASEKHQLYSVFRKDELQILLQLIRDSSIQLLEQGLDSLGYEMQ